MNGNDEFINETFDKVMSYMIWMMVACLKQNVETPEANRPTPAPKKCKTTAGDQIHVH